MGFLSGLFGKKNELYETYHENGQLKVRYTYATFGNSLQVGRMLRRTGLLTAHS